MLRITAFILLPSAILAANYGYNPHNGARNKPLDYYDDSIKPDSSFVFNFEQLRNDQPPQVEMREEQIGRYMYRKPVTTTEEPVIYNRNFRSRIPERESLPHSNNLPSLNNNYGQQHWNSNPKQSTTMAPPPPPPAPKWADYSNGFTNTQTFPHYESHSQNIAQQYNDPAQYSRPHYSPVTTKPASKDFGNLHMNPNNNAPIQQTRTRNFGRDNIHQPINEPVQYSPEPVNHRVPSRNSRTNLNNEPAINRGSHKFSWSDVTDAPEFRIPTSTMATMNSGRNPPPVPTLSPWQDGYGK